jgi:TPR repeat protein
VYWYQKAADQGYAEAQSILGVMYANGKGVLKDLSKRVNIWGHVVP